MSMGIKVAELNTLSDAKGITGIRFFNEMEDTPSQEEEEVNPHRFRSQICRKMSVFTKLHGHKTIEAEFRIRVERPLLPRSR